MLSNSLTFQEAMSPVMENLIFLHDYAMIIIFTVTWFLINMYMLIIIPQLSNKFVMTNPVLELTWTILPMIMLCYLANPSLKILYLTDDMTNPVITIKTIGHQWYWSYEYTDLKTLEFDSFMIKNFSINNFRLLEVDNRMIIPYNSSIRILTTSLDVIHAWTIPCLGVKVDSIPGRINQTFIFSNQTGLFFGQCSEICGMNHSFMPIMIESTSKKYFIKWIKSMI